MTKKKMSHSGEDRAALKKTFDSSNLTATSSRIKAAIVGAVCWGMLPRSLAAWLIRRLRLEGA